MQLWMEDDEIQHSAIYLVRFADGDDGKWRIDSIQ